MVWKRSRVRPEQWRPLPHSTKQMLADEQDTAAGGRRHRIVIAAAPSLGRIILQVKHNRLYAELRWQYRNNADSAYLGEVTAPTRAENLAAGWQKAVDRGLVADRSGTVETGSHQGSND